MNDSNFPRFALFDQLRYPDKKCKFESVVTIACSPEFGDLEDRNYDGSKRASNGGLI